MRSHRQHRRRMRGQRIRRPHLKIRLDPTAQHLRIAARSQKTAIQRLETAARPQKTAIQRLTTAVKYLRQTAVQTVVLPMTAVLQVTVMIRQASEE